VVVNPVAQTNAYTAANGAGAAVAVNNATQTALITGLASNVTYNVSVWGLGPVTSFLFNTTSFTTLPTAPTPPVGLVPANGAVNVPVNGPAFAWSPPAIAGTITGYNYELTTDPLFVTLTEGTATPTVPYLVWSAALEYETAYYWRVRAVTASGVSVWITSVFTTVIEIPSLDIVIPPPADIILEQPDITITSPPITVTIPTAETPGYIWGIIGIGAALVIAVIILIVRTRRVV
jgi:hypothetical protein